MFATSWLLIYIWKINNRLTDSHCLKSYERLYSLLNYCIMQSQMRLVTANADFLDDGLLDSLLKLLNHDVKKTYAWLNRPDQLENVFQRTGKDDMPHWIAFIYSY